MKRVILLVAAHLACCGLLHASASDAYLAQTAQGAGTGADCADAYAYSFFNSGANWGSGAEQIGPGTTVHLCGTITVAANTNALTAQGSGSSGNPVTIKFETNAILQAPYFPTIGGITLDNQSYITIDGGTNGLIQNTLNGSPTATCPGGACQFQNQSEVIRAVVSPNTEIKNLTVGPVYIHAQCEDPSGVTCDETDGLINALVFSGSNSLIHDNVFHDGEKLVVTNSPANGDSNYRVYNNYFYNYDNGFNFGAGANVVLNSVYVYNNHFGSMLNWDAPGGSPYHKEAIHGFSSWGTGGANAGWVQNFYMYNNLFDGSEGQCCITSMIFLEGNSNAWGGTNGTAYIWNNLIFGNLATSNGQLAVSGGNGHQIFNNTIVDTDINNAGACLLIGSASTPAKNVSIENNAMQGCSTYLAGSTASSFTTIDYNAYGKNVATGNPVWSYERRSAVKVITLPAWRSECNCDLHSAAHLGSFFDMNSMGVPGATFIGVSAATNLTSLAKGDMASLASTTMAGGTATAASRPSSGPWDVGAYDHAYKSPPKKLRAVAH